MSISMTRNVDCCDREASTSRCYAADQTVTTRNRPTLVQPVVGQVGPIQVVIRAVGLLLVLVLAAMALGLAAAILAVMVHQAMGVDRRLVPAPTPPRRIPAARLDIIQTVRPASQAIPVRATRAGPTPVMAATIPARAMARAATNDMTDCV